MSLEKLKTKIRRANEEVWLKGNLDALDEIYSADCVLHSPPLPDVRGLEALKEHIAGIRSAYSESQLAYAEMVGEGDRIVYRYTWRARHTGQSQTLPIPPTGKEVGMEKCVVVRVVDAKIVEEFEYADYLGFLQQLGVVPPLG
jgi:predicted ester cyclase